MTQLRGSLRKMLTAASAPVSYRLPIGNAELPLNDLLGRTMRLEYAGEITCLACGQRTKKSFNQGYCFRCFSTLARCDVCIVKPELCHFARGTCREPEWGQANCLQPHYVYLANSSGLKVGITRASHIPTRWLDQGASQALLCLRTPSRYDAGLLEVALKRFVADRTDWRKMLSGEPPQLDLQSQREELLGRCEAIVAHLNTSAEEPANGPLTEEKPQVFFYPILAYPKKISAFNLDKTPLVEGSLLGVQGQYLLFDTGVLNIRKFAGYHVKIEIES